MPIFVLICTVMTDGDPVAILKRADAATEQLERVQYQARAWGEGALDGRIATIKAEVRAERSPAGAPRLHLRASIRQPGSRNARNQTIVRSADRVVNTVNGVARSFDLRDGNARIAPVLGAVWMRELAMDDPFRDEINADLQQYEGLRRVGGVECHVVYVAYANRRGEARWYFGKRDYLPRRVDRILAAGSRVLEIRDLDFTSELDTAIFLPETDNTSTSTASGGAARR